MAILLFLLRLIGWVLLAVLLLLFVALLIPLGVRFAYRPGSVRATACYGPLHSVSYTHLTLPTKIAV